MSPDILMVGPFSILLANRFNSDVLPAPEAPNIAVNSPGLQIPVVL